MDGLGLKELLKPPPPSQTVEDEKSCIPDPAMACTRFGVCVCCFRLVFLGWF